MTITNQNKDAVSGMSWKKGLFSYILWAIYTVAVCAGVIAAGLSFCSVAGISAGYGILVAVVYLGAVGLLVLSVKKLANLSDFSEQMESMSARVIESAIVVLSLAVGVYLRLDYISGITDVAGGAELFEAAKVVAGQSVPQVVHGATYLYLQLLHTVFMLLGNKVLVCAGFQIVLQVLSALFFYIAVRRFSGMYAGLTAMLFFMLSSVFVADVAIVSPAILLLLIYSAVFCLFVSCMKSTSCNALIYFICSVLAGIVIYLDIFGLTLFVFVGGFLLTKKEWNPGFLGSRPAMVTFSIFGGLAGFFGSIALDAFASGKQFFNVLTACCKLWIPQIPKLPALTERSGGYLGLVVLVIFLTVGIYSFWYRKKYESQSIWIAASVVLACMVLFGLQAQNADGLLFLYLFLAVLGGVGLDALFAEEAEDAEAVAQSVTAGNGMLPAEGKGTQKVKVSKKEKAARKASEKAEAAKKKAEAKRNKKAEKEAEKEAKKEAEKEAKKAAKKEKASKRNSKKDKFDVIEQIAEQEAAELASAEQGIAEPASKAEDRPKVQFLDNPLPLPKKHEPKVLGYRLNDTEQDWDYDIEVADDDDFDI